MDGVRRRDHLQRIAQQQPRRRRRRHHGQRVHAQPPAQAAQAQRIPLRHVHSQWRHLVGRRRQRRERILGRRRWRLGQLDQVLRHDGAVLLEVVARGELRLGPGVLAHHDPEQRVGLGGALQPAAQHPAPRVDRLGLVLGVGEFPLDLLVLLDRALRLVELEQVLLGEQEVRFGAAVGGVAARLSELRQAVEAGDALGGLVGEGRAWALLDPHVLGARQLEVVARHFQGVADAVLRLRGDRRARIRAHDLPVGVEPSVVLPERISTVPMRTLSRPQRS